MPSLPNRASQLNYQGIYPCPVCHVGEISTLSLMEAMACQFCHHIFTADLKTQRLQMADKVPPLTWYWNGKSWVGAHIKEVQLSWIYAFAGVALIALPSTLVGLGAYLFPPLPGTPLAWLPTAWVGLTFLAHLAIVSWLVVEFYQFPVFAYLRAMRQHFLER